MKFSLRQNLKPLNKLMTSVVKTRRCISFFYSDVQIGENLCYYHLHLYFL